jgi:hypothetical protein
VQCQFGILDAFRIDAGEILSKAGFAVHGAVLKQEDFASVHLDPSRGGMGHMCLPDVGVHGGFQLDPVRAVAGWTDDRWLGPLQTSGSGVCLPLGEADDLARSTLSDFDLAFVDLGAGGPVVASTITEKLVP